MDFQVNGHRYKCSELNVKQQFHIARKFAPVLIGAGSIGGQDEFKDPGAFARALTVFSSPLSEQDAEDVINRCLSVVQREQPGDTGWANILVSNRMMFSDIKLDDMLMIVWHVLQAHGLIRFFDVPASTSREEAGRASTGSTSPAAMTGYTDPSPLDGSGMRA